MLLVLCTTARRQGATHGRPHAATITQLRNIQAKTGQSIAALHAVLAASGLAKTAERRSLLMQKFSMGYGDANAVALCCGKPVPALDGSAPTAAAATDSADPLEAIYTGTKAPLRPLHLAVLQVVQGMGAFEQATKKTDISLRRQKQFAMVGPATKDQVEIRLNAKGLPVSSRLKAMPPGGMCQYTVRIRSIAEVDAELLGWLRTAYDAAG